MLACCMRRAAAAADAVPRGPHARATELSSAWELRRSITNGAHGIRSNEMSGGWGSDVSLVWSTHSIKYDAQNAHQIISTEKNVFQLLSL